MDKFHFLTVSLKAAFPKQIKAALKSASRYRLLPGFLINQLTYLPEEIPAELVDVPLVVLVDLESFIVDVEGTVNHLTEHLPGKALVFISDQDDSNLDSLSKLTSPHFLLTKDELSSPLLAPFLSSLICHAALVQDNLLVQENLNNRLNELLLIRKASLHLTLNLSLDSVLEAILEGALELINADDAHIFFYEHGVLSFGAALFDGDLQKKPFLNPRPEGLTYKVAREGTALVVNDMRKDPLFNDQEWEGSIIGIPLKIGNKVLGVMNVALHRPHIFLENEIQSLEFLGDQASIAIQNANLYEQAQQEIADRIKAEEAIKHLANHDALTGLPNRRLFNERINLEISRSQRNKQRIGIMVFDLDHLKKVNDSYGHNVGDLLLQAVAQRLLGLLRKSDTVARMGGDEFLLILPEMQHQGDAVQTAERILDALSTPFHLEGYQIDITTSIGIAFFPDDGDEVNLLVKNADIAMYKAKEKGGNGYHIFTS